MKIKVLACIFVCIYFASSATLFKGTSEEVNFNSNPQKAEVWVNGILIGETPLALKLESKKTYVIDFKNVNAILEKRQSDFLPSIIPVS